MMHSDNSFQKVKISPEFRARLEHLDPEQKVRAIVMLRTRDAASVTTRQEARANRQDIVSAIRQSAEAALEDIDRVLEHFRGQRLTARANALGSVPVETTAAGITALAALDTVKVVLEDQAISLLPNLKRAS